jgi:cytosine/adenosine deaminase-related metal-dependent hydrolase
VPAGLRETTEASLAESIRLIEKWHGTEGDRLRYALAPRFVLSCTEGLLRKVQDIATERGVRIHTHASENATECDVVREKTGMDNVAYFHHLGMLGKHTTLAHCVWLTAEEQKLIRETQTRIAHCPSANFKLASGVAKVPELLKQGIVVGLGADGAPCNNNLDIFMELRLAALIHLPRGGPTSMSAMQALELATLNGAKALGLEGEIGVLQEGARADVITVDLSQVHSTPSSDDAVSSLVYSGQSRDVRDVVINGQIVMRERRVHTMDEAAVIAAGRQHSQRLVSQLD